MSAKRELLPDRRVLRRFSCSFSSSSSIRGIFEYEDDDEQEDDSVAAEPLRAIRGFRNFLQKETPKSSRAGAGNKDSDRFRKILLRSLRLLAKAFGAAFCLRHSGARLWLRRSRAR